MIAIYGERNGQWLNYRYEHIPQTNEQIVQNRAVVDRVLATEATQAGLPGGQPAQQPQHMQNAPHPSQMPAGHYPQTQQPPPGYVQQPAQGYPQGYPQQPAQGYPQAPVQGYPVAPQQPAPVVPVQQQIGIPGLPGIKF
jgi:hypothetical protein